HGGDGRTARIAESGAVARFGAARAARYRHPIILTPRQKPGPGNRRIDNRECDIFHGALSWSFAEGDEPLKMPAPELGCGHDACPDHVVRSGSRRGGAVSGATATTPQWQCS